jgi:hypothetical protein
MTAIQRGQTVKLVREFPYDQLHYDHFTGLMIARIGHEFFQFTPNFIDGLWNRDLRFFPSQSSFPFGYEKLCSWNISNPLSWIVVDRHIFYMLTDKSLYIMPICNHNETKFFKILDSPSQNIPFYLFPLKESPNAQVLINYNGKFFPSSVLLPILTLIFVLLFVFKERLTKFVNSNNGENEENTTRLQTHLNPNPPPPMYNLIQNYPQESPYDDRSIVIPKN